MTNQQNKAINWWLDLDVSKNVELRGKYNRHEAILGHETIEVIYLSEMRLKQLNKNNVPFDNLFNE